MQIEKHLETITLDLGNFPKNPVILGMPWLKKHNPAIDWKNYCCTFLPLNCRESCSLESTCKIVAYPEHLVSLNLVKENTLLVNLGIQEVGKSVASEQLFQTEGQYNLTRKKEAHFQSGNRISHIQILNSPLNNAVETSEQNKSSTMETKTLSSSKIPLDYSDLQAVFSKKNAELLPKERPYDCPIDLIDKNSIPPYRALYQLTEPEMKVLENYIKENLQKGFIRPSKSPSGAPIFFVKKKNGELRPCIDYRGLNEMTIKNRYPLPLINSLLDRLTGSKYFTKIDLRGAYNLVRIKKGDEWKTAFRCRYGHFEYLVMPFGLTNAPAIFQNMMNDIFKEYLDYFVVILLDDILIFSKNLDDHKHHVRLVLEKLQQWKLYAKLEKCFFHQQEIEFLGYIIGPNGIKMCPDKTSSIKDWPTPNTITQVQSFLGFANFYRRFIYNYSKIAKPLTDLTKQNQQFQWNSEAGEAFQQLKKSLTQDPLLVHPDTSKPFTVHTDASNYAIGAVLSQNGHPVAYYSRKLLNAEINYAVHDKELLAIVASFTHWRHYLVGSAFSITVYCDHKNLTFFRVKRLLKQRHARWAETLSEFNFQLHYVPGNQNAAADALSRREGLAPEEGDKQHTYNETL